MIVYAHRFKGLLQQTVLDLGLVVSLCDSDSPISLSDNEIMLRDLAESMRIKMERTANSNNEVVYTFRRAI